MTTTSAVPAVQREPALPGRTVVVIGGSAGIGLETARRARAEGASVILTGRDPDRLDQRRDQLRATLPIRRVAGPEDVAALAVHIMTNTALTGATYDIDGGQQLVQGA
jgi:NAD(P)-dependent dehydrogenase (short-subunit alcohol dehydrogenase family)